MLFSVGSWPKQPKVTSVVSNVFYFSLSLILNKLTVRKYSILAFISFKNLVMINNKFLQHKNYTDSKKEKKKMLSMLV